MLSALHKLETDGLLTTDTQIVDGRARKYYSLTRDGHKQAVSRVSELVTFVENLNLVLRIKPAR